MTALGLLHFLFFGTRREELGLFHRYLLPRYNEPEEILSSCPPRSKPHLIIQKEHSNQLPTAMCFGKGQQNASEENLRLEYVLS